MLIIFTSHYKNKKKNFFQLLKTHLWNWNWVIIWNQTVTCLSICHLFFEQKQPENKEIQHLWEPLCGFNSIQYLLWPQQLQSSGLYIIYMRQALKSTQDVLWHYMALHAQDTSCSKVQLHLRVDGSQSCMCTLVTSTAFSDPHLCRLCTFQVPYLRYIFHFLSHTKASPKVWGPK